MMLERNGKLSSSERTKHIATRHYFIKDKIQKGEVDEVHCPAEEMIADFFTKPLQGQLFFKFRKEIVGEEWLIDATMSSHLTMMKKKNDMKNKK